MGVGLDQPPRAHLAFDFNPRKYVQVRLDIRLTPTPGNNQIIKLTKKHSVMVLLYACPFVQTKPFNAAINAPDAVNSDNGSPINY
jgi:hypothetical protein